MRMQQTQVHSNERVEKFKLGKMIAILVWYLGTGISVVTEATSQLN